MNKIQCVILAKQEASAFLPVVLKPKSKGQETAKARIHTVAIITDTLLRELSVVLYSTGITTAVYLQRNSQNARRLQPQSQ